MWDADFAWVGLEFLVRCGSRILRCRVGWKWLRLGIFAAWCGVKYSLVRCRAVVFLLHTEWC